MSRIMHPDSGNTIIVPMDHHGTTIAPVEGKENIHEMCQGLIDGGADAILGHQ